MLGNGEEGLSLLSSLFFLSSILFRHNSVLIYPHRKKVYSVCSYDKKLQRNDRYNNVRI